MKKFLPYFKLLLPVKGRFAIALIAAVIYGAASGFGVPFMTAIVFPKLFSSNESGVTYAVKEASINNKHYDLGVLEAFPSSDKLYYTSSAKPLVKIAVPEASEFRVDGSILHNSEPIAYNQLYYKGEEGDYTEVENLLYVKKSDGKYYKVSPSDKKKNKRDLIFAVLMLPAVFLVRGVAGFVNTYYITFCGQRVLESIRQNVFEKLQRLDLGFFQQNGTGALMTRIMTEAARLQQMLTSASNDLIKQPISLIGAISALIYLSIKSNAWFFIFVCLVVIPVCVFPIRYFSKHIRRKMRQGSAGEGKIGNCLQENIVAARDVRSFNLQERETEKFNKLQATFYKKMLGMTRYRAIVTPSVEFITTIGVSVAIYVSAKNGMTLEKVVPLIAALYMSYEPMKRLANLQSRLTVGTVAIERLEDILNTEEKLTEPSSPKELPPLQGGIIFDDVTFSYSDDGIVLNKINTVINSGEVVALVGPSGAGKSTFTHLIARMYDITKGKILFDHYDITEHALADLRAQVSVVSQDPYLFNDTVENNIRLGKLDATSDEIRLAAKNAYCLDFIEELPKGFKTVVGEKASRLSGGQRQRLAIARAFLKNAPILILDEATSALDADSEQAVQGALADLVKGRTTLIIAHRFSSIQIANRILVFDKGEIVADGNHDSLMNSSDIYKDLYLKQNI